MATDWVIAAWSVVRPKSNMTSYEEHIELWAEIAPYNELSRQFESEPMLDQIPRWLHLSGNGMPQADPVVLLHSQVSRSGQVL